MTYGMQVFGDNGRVIIDGVRPIYTLVMSGSVSLGLEHSTPAGDVYSASVYVPPAYRSTGFVAFKITPGAVSCQYVRGDTRIQIKGANNPGPVSYAFFAALNVVGASSEAYGMRLYNSGGGLIFDSGRQIFNIVSRATVYSNGKSLPVSSGDYIIAYSGGPRRHILIRFGISAVLMATYLRYNAGQVDTISGPLRPSNPNFYSTDDYFPVHTITRIRIA